MLVRKLVFALCLFAAPASAQEGHKASFDCAKARTPVEKAICGSYYAAELDRAMDELYRAAIARAPGQRAASEAAQRQWLAARDARCGRAKPDTECLTRFYKDRIVALVRIARDAKDAPIAGRYVYGEKGEAGELFLAEMPDGTTFVLIDTINVAHVSPHSCSFLQRLKDRRGDVLRFNDPQVSKTCALEIAVTGNRAVVREAPKDCYELASYFCGAHGFMLGNYVRR